MPTRTGAKKHTHMYRKLPNSIWCCSLPDCTHYLPTNVEWMIEGRVSLCHKCTGKLIMTTDKLKLPNPICDECVLKEKGINKSPEDIMAYLDSKLDSSKKVTSEFISSESSNQLINDSDKDGSLI